jgi:hypothetical protein
MRVIDYVGDVRNVRSHGVILRGMQDGDLPLRNRLGTYANLLLN